MVVRFSPDPDPMAVVLQEVAQSGLYSRGRVMVAFATTAGVRVFYSAIGADLCAQTDVIVGTSMFDTDAQAVANLHNVCNSVSIVHANNSQTFHPKMYMFDDGTEEGLPEQARLIVGSSNLYDRSLRRNFEANVDHVLHPVSNPEHAILWESALAAWGSEAVAQRTHLIGESGDAAAEIRNWIDQRVLRAHQRRRRPSTGSSGGSSSGTTAQPTTVSPATQIDLQALPAHGLEIVTAPLPLIEPEPATEGTPQPPDELPAATQPAQNQRYVTQMQISEYNNLVGVGGKEIRIPTPALNDFEQFWGWQDNYVLRDSQREWYWDIVVNLHIEGQSVQTLESCTLQRRMRQRTSGTWAMREFSFRVPYLSLWSNRPSNAELEECLYLLSLSETTGVDFDLRLVLTSDADYEFWIGECNDYDRRNGLGCGYYPALPEPEPTDDVAE